MLTGIAAFSYAVAALAFLVLSILLLTGWRARRHGALMTTACLLSCLWATLCALHAHAPGTPGSWVPLVEVMRNAAWCATLVALLGRVKDAPRSTAPRWIACGFVLVFLLFAAYGLHPWPSQTFGLMPIVGAFVGMAVLGMLLVEQLYRSRPLQERWAIKFACLGIGFMFVYDFYLYSDFALFRRIDGAIWAARGFVNALTIPLLAISVGRSASWSSGFALSRHVLFHSATLFGSAIYLLVMGTAGYFLRYFGGEWGSVMQVALLFGAGILLAGVLFSGAFRSWLKVFISKHFYSYNYDYREEWMRFTRTLSEKGPGLGERTIQAVAALVESPGGGLWIRRDSGLCEPAAQWHVPPRVPAISMDSPFCRFLEQRQWVFDLEEYAATPELYGSVELPAAFTAVPRAWLVVPLMLQGRLFGFVLLTQPRSSINLNWEVIDLLKIAGSQAASYLAQEEAAADLMLARQFESFNRMSTFIVHDLKNLVSQLSLLSANAEKHRNNPEFQADMVETVGYSVQKMKLLLQRLSRGGSPEHPVPLAIDQVLRQAVALKAAFEPKPTLQIDEPGLVVLADRERLERVLGHLIQNAIEATPREGSVRIALRRHDGQVQVQITDTGEGMSEEFIRERLFRPFESTKSAGMGIGAFESRSYIEELGGQLEVSSRPPFGSTFSIRLPVYEQQTMNIEKAA
jgi:putative PEP-CTERM system histidine kinase